MSDPAALNPDTGPIKSFFAVLRSGSVDEVAARLDVEPDLINSFDPDPWCCRATPLNVAVSRSDRSLIELLLDRGADPDRKSDWWAGGFAPLHSVKPEAREWLLPLLTSRGATIDEQAAAMHGLTDELSALIDRRPMRVNVPGGDGGRPLHFAADIPTAELLLARGAWIDPIDVDHGSTPAQWALAQRPAVARLLVEHGARVDPFMVCALDDVERVRAMIAADPDVIHHAMTRQEFPSPGSPAGHIYSFTLGGYGLTPLHVAAGSGAVKVIELLVNAGADSGLLAGHANAAALHSAASTDRPDAIRALVAAGADIDQLSGDPHWSSPLVWARACVSSNAEATLVELGAQALNK